MAKVRGPATERPDRPSARRVAARNKDVGDRYRRRPVATDRAASRRAGGPTG